MTIPFFELLGRLALGTALSALIGLERESAQKSAGLRTHTLVGLGATLFAVVSLEFPGGDPSRIAAQVVTGIGFLGAGAIFRMNASIRGLTTAAALWLVAAIGLAAGAGLAGAAVTATVLGLIVLFAFSYVESLTLRRGRRRRVVVEVTELSAVGAVCEAAARIDGSAAQVGFERGATEAATVVLDLAAELSDTVVAVVGSLPNVASIGPA